MAAWFLACAGASQVGTNLARAETIAVLPFANVSSPAVANAAGMDWIGASIAETLRQSLATRGRGVSGMDLLGREQIAEAYSLLRLRPMAPLTQASILKLGETLRADRVLSGTFSYQPPAATAPPGSLGSLNIAARILDPRTFAGLATFEETGPLDTLAALEAHLSWRMLTQLAPRAAPPEADYLSLRAPVRLDAEENYIRGLLAATAELREKYFLQAARLDPRDWRPAFELGKIFVERKTYREAAPWLERVRPTDTAFPEASFLLGLSKFQSGDTAAAQQVLERLSETTPWSGVFNNLGAAQSRNGVAAADSFRKAIDGDPSDPDYRFNLAYVLWKSGDFDAAADGFRAVLERDPADSMATLLLGRSITRQGPRTEATADARLLSLERIKVAFGDPGYRSRALSPTR